MVRGVNLVPRSHSVAVGDLGTGVGWGEGHTISYTKQDDNKMDKTQCYNCYLFNHFSLSRL